MLTVKYLVEAPKEYRDFVDDLISSINYFKEAVEYFDDSKAEATIKNTDLWIEAYIDIIPGLQAFRDIVRSEMKRLNINPHSDFTYKEENHFIYSYKKEIERFRNVMNKSKNN